MATASHREAVTAFALRANPVWFTAAECAAATGHNLASIGRMCYDLSHGRGPVLKTAGKHKRVREFLYAHVSGEGWPRWFRLLGALRASHAARSS